jgi:aryl-alcohol dehydrogenase-like predicted oxidoreductase
LFTRKAKGGASFPKWRNLAGVQPLGSSRPFAATQPDFQNQVEDSRRGVKLKTKEAGMNANDLASTSGMTRRRFTQITAAAGVLAILPHSWSEERKGDMIYRTLGRTGEKVSAIGLGGFHIANPSDENESTRIIRRAVDSGITFMDNCWDYHDGASEVRMGKALRDGYRDRVFLMTKIDGRDRKTAAKQIDDSLIRLQTDRIDLMQMHEVIRAEDPEKVFASGGGMEAMIEARKAGKLRYLGFTGHKDPAIHLKMLDTAAAHQFRFDTVQMPLNVMDAHFNSFEKKVLPRLVKEEIGVLGMKSMGGGVILESKAVEPIECLHYALTLPTSVVITGMESMKNLDQALEAARTFKPLSAEAIGALLHRTKEYAEKGKYELFKTTTTFDGTVQHPEWLG